MKRGLKVLIIILVILVVVAIAILLVKHFTTNEVNNELTGNSISYDNADAIATMDVVIVRVDDTYLGVINKDDSNDIMMITDTGTIIRISVKDVSVLGRSTQGVTLMRTNDGGKVVSIELVEPEETNEE